MLADDLLDPWRDALEPTLPPGELFDVHTHIGRNDPDGFRSTPEELLETLDRAGARAVVFPMHEPAGYPPANDEVIAAAAAAGGRLVPFCRLDPRDSPRAEAERCLDAGARGIKLHPRAERFRLEEPETEPIFAVAGERGLPVLVHAGRGIPALGRDALDVCARHPGLKLILAHAGVCDLAWIWRHAADHPNLYFDTAWWSVVDLLTLFALVPPGQILFGSDAPYGTPRQASLVMARCALQAGIAPGALAAVRGGQLRRILADEDPLDCGAAPGTGTLSNDPLLMRVHSYLTTAIGRMLLSEAADEYIALARLACDVPDDSPQAPVCRSVLALLDRSDRYRAALEAGAEGPAQRFPGVHLIVIASVVALTPDVALPLEPASAGSRAA